MREIDKEPTPVNPLAKKLVVLSAPRTATAGTYHALKALGYKPYHVYEAIDKGPKALMFLREATEIAKRGSGQPYGRMEFDKWLGDYDVIMETPFLVDLPSFVHAFPEARFLLVERDPGRWAVSFYDTVLLLADKGSRFPMNLLCFVSDMFNELYRYNAVVLEYFLDGHGRTAAGQQALVKHYTEYLAEVKRLVPPEKLTVYRLEDGFGWEELCSYLGEKVPNTPWPLYNRPEEFHHFAQKRAQEGMKKIAVRVVKRTAAFTVPIIGVVVWFYGNKWFGQ